MSSIFSKFNHSKDQAPSAPTATPPIDEIPVTPILETASEPAPISADNTAPVPSMKKSKTNLNLKNFMSSKMAILGGFGFIMLILAISLQIAARSRSTPETTEEVPVETGPEITGTDTLTTDWPLYEDPYNSYTIQYPEGWMPENSSVESTKLFGLPDNVKFEINVSQTRANNVESYLLDLDASRSTAWEGRPSRVVNKTSVIRVGNYDGFERSELVSAAGIEYQIVYIMVDDDVFRFSLIPGSKDTSIKNQELVRQFRLALKTFKITNVSERLGEWKTYDSTKVEGLSFPSYSISFPATWSISEKKGDATGSASLSLTISRNGYKLILNQAAVGGAVCLFKDSPAFQGSSGDLRNKEYTEYQTDAGYILRRYFKESIADNTTFLFCGKSEADTYFQTPLTVGGLTYTVPAKYDPGVIKEMDNIVKTLEPK